jgi:acyl dehydratase
MRGDKFMSNVTFSSVKLEEKLPEVVQEVTQERIWKYAAASLDFNPVHIDPEWVKTAQPFSIPVTVAHGMMTISFVTSVLTNWAFPSGGWVRKIDVKLTKPAPPGTVEKCGGIVTEKHPRGKNQSFVVVEVWAENQNGEKLAVGTAEVVLPD